MEEAEQFIRTIQLQLHLFYYAFVIVLSMIEDLLLAKKQVPPMKLTSQEPCRM